MCMCEFRLFAPMNSDINSIPQSPGNYIFVLKEDSALPNIGIEPIYTQYKGLNVIYTGQTTDSLRKRLSYHYKRTARVSTFRKSIGRLMGYKLIPKSGKTSFSEYDEVRLSEWLRKNTLCYYMPNYNYDKIEQELINKFSPPINLDKTWHLTTNIEFRYKLKQLRTNK